MSKRRISRSGEAKRLKRLVAKADKLGHQATGPGPIERLWRNGRITEAQLWTATRFASAYEATTDRAPISAGSFECRLDVERLPWVDRERLGKKYHDAVSTLQEDDFEAGRIESTAAILLLVTYHQISPEEIDGRLKKRKESTRNLVLKALDSLADYWELDRAKEISLEPPRPAHVGAAHP